MAENIESSNKQMERAVDFHVPWRRLNIISRTNKILDETAPWVLAKEDGKEQLVAVMAHLAAKFVWQPTSIQPFMMTTSNAIM